MSRARLVTPGVPDLKYAAAMRARDEMEAAKTLVEGQIDALFEQISFLDPECMEDVASLFYVFYRYDLDRPRAALLLQRLILTNVLRSFVRRFGAYVFRSLEHSMYKLLRSRSEPTLYLICRGGELGTLPEAVRRRGPWETIVHGPVMRLKQAHRTLLDRHGYVLEVSETRIRPESNRGKTQPHGE